MIKIFINSISKNTVFVSASSPSIFVWLHIFQVSYFFYIYFKIYQECEAFYINSILNHIKLSNLILKPFYTASQQQQKYLTHSTGCEHWQSTHSCIYILIRHVYYASHEYQKWQNILTHHTFSLPFESIFIKKTWKQEPQSNPIISAHQNNVHVVGHHKPVWIFQTKTARKYSALQMTKRHLVSLRNGALSKTKSKATSLPYIHPLDCRGYKSLACPPMERNQSFGFYRFWVLLFCYLSFFRSQCGLR